MRFPKERIKKIPPGKSRTCDFSRWIGDMAKFLKCPPGRVNESEVYVNLDYVVSFRTDNTGTALLMTNGRQVQTSEKLDDILAVLKD